jgi:DNA-binding MarR family transcriptional regulator
MVADNPREHLAFLIHDVAKRLRLEFGRRAARFDLTPAQARCLVFLGLRPGASLKALATALEVRPMSVLRVIDGLEDRKLLRRETDPDDRRALRLFLSKPGEAAAERIWRVLDDIVADAATDMSTAARRDLVRCLMQVSAGMQKFDQDKTDQEDRR